MTALEEYEKVKSWGSTYMEEALFNADAAIESLKCCGNCWWYDDGGYDRPTCEVDDRTASSDDSCHLTPSSWKESR